MSPEISLIKQIFLMILSFYSEELESDNMAISSADINKEISILFYCLSSVKKLLYVEKRENIAMT